MATPIQPYSEEGLNSFREESSTAAAAIATFRNEVEKAADEEGISVEAFLEREVPEGLLEALDKITSDRQAVNDEQSAAAFYTYQLYTHAIHQLEGQIYVLALGDRIDL
ncbi:molybdopterin/thiamine biosynthesis adenylyltransferase [Xanthomonas arboricola]|uniref:hypothetical protein n=1 Tax=Xanthomonas euroxanthea TaxID=2259622 RepID=UPI00141B42A1|nr:hypothetical protein [Xanthomonas euroxanthea]NIK06851.1 molybdopterin/thiamine biosynthesis adenylyltransferase [Xanthomonas euroxanthea]